jgi:hypothetical protein
MNYFQEPGKTAIKQDARLTEKGHFPGALLRRGTVEL